MDTYNTLLDIPAEATAEEIAAAYQRQRERYDPTRVAALGAEFRRIGEARTADLGRAYTVPADPRRRRAYDVSLGVTPRQPARGAPGRAQRLFEI